MHAFPLLNSNPSFGFSHLLSFCFTCRLCLSKGTRNMSLISKIRRSLNFFALCYCTFMCGTSAIDLNSRYQNMERFENSRRRRKMANSMPIACRVCDRVFFDNYSLVVHFDEAHHTEEIPAPSQDVRTLASLRSESQFPSNPPLFPCSSVDRMSEARQEGFQSMYNYSRPRAVPVFSEKSPNVLLRNGSLLKKPCLLNSMPPLGPRSYALGLTTVLPLQLSGADGEKGCFPNNDVSQIKYLGKRYRETIVISDGEEDELDLTLKL